MDDKKLRRRGWSIQSDTSAQTTQSELELTEEEKRKLLENFPKQEEDQDHHYEENPNKKLKLEGKPQEIESIEEKSIDNVTTTKAKVPPELLAHAKSKLSKWAARLFDPDRPRGLIQPPQIIPLNDEFLIAFGKREKLFDEKLGRKIVLDEEEITANDDEDDEIKNGIFEEIRIIKKDIDVNNKKDLGNLNGRKLKITNLPYVLNKEALIQACSVFGPVSDVNLIMDKDGQLKGGQPMNIGRAYVIFEKPENAKNCMEKMFRLKGRALRISMADNLPPRNNKGSRSLTSRYYIQDISTKCFRCGEIGHIEASCPNPTKLKPCAFCGKTDHDMRDCSLSKVCFRCGRPGHINRDCPEKEAIGRKRVVCGICFGSGHHRVNCQLGPYDAPNVDQVICMVCGSLGHFMCQEMKWFFGLEGITCFNCGRNGHHGYRCDRPNFDVCLRDEALVKQELERQHATQFADEYLQQQNQGRDRSINRVSRNIYRPRTQSQPPPQRHNIQRDNGRGYSGETAHRSIRTLDSHFSNRRNKENRGYSTSRYH